jgi:glycosyltransferase 2 family protein
MSKTATSGLPTPPTLVEAERPHAPSGDGRRVSSRKRWGLLALGLVLSVGLPVLAFQGVNIAQSWQLVLQCHGPQLALGGAFFLLTLGVRSWRWRLMLAAHQPVKLRSCLSATCVGYLANNILPFHLSELVRVGVLKRLEGVSGARGLGTVAVERVVDTLTLVLFLGVYLTLTAGGEYRTELVTAGWLALTGSLVLVLALMVSYRWRRQCARIAAALPARISPSLGAKTFRLFGHFLEGFQVFTSPRQVLQVVLLSAGLWGAAVCSHYYVGQSLGLSVRPLGYTVVVFATAFGVLIPAAPGAVGTFHGFARLGLYLVGAQSGEQALAFAAVLHALEWVLMNITGLYFLVSDRLSLTAAAVSGGGEDAAQATACPGVGAADHPQPL